jgi:glycosyltransferase involved in cell wall biosynthesis
VNILFVSSTRAGGSGLSQRQLAARLIARGHRVVILADPEEGHRLTRYLYKRQVNLSTKLRGHVVGPLLLTLQRPIGRRVVPAPAYDVPVFFSPVPEHAYRTMRRRFPPDVVVASSIDRVSWRRLRRQLRADGVPSVLYLREDVAHGHLSITNAPPDLLLANAGSLAERARTAGFDCLVIPSTIETGATRVASTRERVLFVNPLSSHGVDRLWAVAEARPDIPFAVQESWALSQPARAGVVAEVARLPNVEFRPRTTDLGVVYRDARILFVPHRLDNRPRVVAEAQANGIPVIASAYPGLVEAVGPGGVLVDPEAPDAAWIDAVGQLWDDATHYERLVEAALRHAARPEINPEVVTSRFEEALITLIGGHRAQQGPAGASEIEAPGTP